MNHEHRMPRLDDAPSNKELIDFSRSIRELEATIYDRTDFDGISVNHRPESAQIILSDKRNQYEITAPSETQLSFTLGTRHAFEAGHVLSTRTITLERGQASVHSATRGGQGMRQTDISPLQPLDRDTFDTAVKVIDDLKERALKPKRRAVADSIAQLFRFKRS